MEETKSFGETKEEPRRFERREEESIFSFIDIYVDTHVKYGL